MSGAIIIFSSIYLGFIPRAHKKWKKEYHLPQKYPTGYWTDIEIECHAVFKLFWIAGSEAKVESGGLIGYGLKLANQSSKENDLFACSYGIEVMI